MTVICMEVILLLRSGSYLFIFAGRDDLGIALYLAIKSLIESILSRAIRCVVLYFLLTLGNDANNGGRNLIDDGGFGRDVADAGIEYIILKMFAIWRTS